MGTLVGRLGREAALFGRTLEGGVHYVDPGA